MPGRGSASAADARRVAEGGDASRVKAVHAAARDVGGSRARPLSITVRTPSMVRLVSAMLVARMILRRAEGLQHGVLLLGGERAVQGQHLRMSGGRYALQFALGAADSLDARQKDENVAAVFVGDALPTCLATRCASPPVPAAGGAIRDFSQV